MCEKDDDPCPSLIDRVNRAMADAVADLAEKALRITGMVVNAILPTGDALTAGGLNPEVQGKSDRVVAGVAAVVGSLGAAGDAEKLAARLTNAQAGDLAAHLGFGIRVRGAPFDSHGQAVFSNGRTFITQDVDMHLGAGATWKMFTRRGERLGTFDAMLNPPGK